MPSTLLITLLCIGLVLTLLYIALGGMDDDDGGGGASGDTGSGSLTASNVATALSD